MSKATSDLGSAALRGVTILIGGQGFSRIATFLGNVLIVRWMGDARPLGLASTELHLFHATCLTLGREGVRRACVKGTNIVHKSDLDAQVTSKEYQNWESAASLSRGAALVGAGLVTPLVWAYFSNRNGGAEGKDFTDYSLALNLVGLSVLIELASEPYYVVAQSALMFKLRTGLEALGTLARCLVTLALVILLDAKVWAFGAGYLALASVFLLGYATALPSKILLGGPPSFPKFRLGSSSAAASESSKDVLALSAGSCTFQALWKLVLSEGENVVMLSAGVMAADRGGFALAAGIGSLAARLILAPCEEQAYLLFGKLHRAGESCGKLLHGLTRAAVMFGLAFACVGSQYTHLLIWILYGGKWANETNAPEVLAWYCGLVAVMAVNGVTEAYVQAIADPAETNRFNVWLLTCSVGFVVCAFVLVQLSWGTVGIVASNCLVMACRVGYNIAFSRLELRSFFPSAWSWGAFAIAALTTYGSRTYVYDAGSGDWRAAGAHVTIGALALVGALGVSVYFDDDLRSFAKDTGKNLVRRQAKKSD